MSSSNNCIHWNLKSNLTLIILRKATDPFELETTCYMIQCVKQDYICCIDNQTLMCAFTML